MLQSRSHGWGSCWKQGKMDEIYVLLMFTILHTIDVPAFLFIVILIILSLLWDLKKILPGSKSSTTSWRYREPTTSMDGELTRPVFTKPSGSASLVSALCVPVSMHRTIVPPMRRWLSFFHFTDRETEAETSVHLPEVTRLESGGAGIKKKKKTSLHNTCQGPYLWHLPGMKMWQEDLTL